MARRIGKIESVVEGVNLSGNGNGKSHESEPAPLYRSPARSIYTPEPEPTPEEIAEKKDMDDELSLRIRAERILTIRPRTESEITQDRQKLGEKFKKIGAALTGLAVVGSFVLNGYLLSLNNKKNTAITNYQNNEVVLKQRVADLESLNTRGIEKLQGTLEMLKQKIPIEKIFLPYEELAWGMEMVNNNLVYSVNLEDIVREASNLTDSPKQLFEGWEEKTHGLINYNPLNPEIIPPLIGRTKETVREDNKHTVNTQEVGENTYVAIIGDGVHNGNDLVNKVGGNLFASFKGKVTFDGIYEGHGRLISVLTERKDDGYFYRMNLSHLRLGTKKWNTNQTVNVGDYIATIGSTGFATGPHLHVEFWRSKSARQGTWELYDPYENSTYFVEDKDETSLIITGKDKGKGLVFFYTWNIPEELRTLIAQKVGKN